MLYVDKKEKPYTGWVKEEDEEGRLTKIGYLKDGQRQGVWRSWHANGRKATEIHWQNDQMDGPFEAWHENGRVNAIGQTKDGEVDGEWKNYYSSGQLAEITRNRVGHLVRIKVWHPDGQTCPVSEVEEGNGAYNLYEENGTLKERRVFRSGIQVKKVEKP
jgi:antitoxin component YwqK of YwqJK toxin-antitoxin module